MRNPLCFLSRPLCFHSITDRDVSEEERAEAYWQAPFAVLVQDDSKEAMLEYANKKVCKARPTSQKAVIAPTAIIHSLLIFDMLFTCFCSHCVHSV